jgi:hypothetical protein
LAEA